MTIHKHEYHGDDGFTRVVVQNAVIECEYIPVLGGKMTRLTDRRTGREWLWRHPRMPYQQVPSTANYVAVADTGGWDECFPTVGPCDYPAAPWQGTALADHGELWCQTPTVTWLVQDDAVVYTCVWEGLTLPYTFMRSIEIGAEAAIDVTYRVKNHGEADLQWIWCAHPLVSLEPGMALYTPAGTTFLHANHQGELVSDAPESIVLPDQRVLDLTHLPAVTSAMTAKLYSDVLPSGWVALQAANGRLTMSWDSAEIPQLAVFINAGAWSNDGQSPNYNMGIEPAIGVYDRLSDAYSRTTTYATLPPGQQRSWSVQVQLDAE